jgi:hypothetical protein
MTDLSTLSDAEIDLRIAQAMGAKPLPDELYTPSRNLNLAVDAAERLGYEWQLFRLMDGIYKYGADLFGVNEQIPEEPFTRYADSPARALCIALLLAKGATK